MMKSRFAKDEVEINEHGAIIDWQRGELTHRPRKKRPERNETLYPVLCPGCLNIYRMPSYRAARFRLCATCVYLERSYAGLEG